MATLLSVPAQSEVNPPQPWWPPSLAPRGEPVDWLGGPFTPVDAVYDHRRDRLIVTGQRAGDAPGTSNPQVLDAATGQWAKLSGIPGATTVDTDRGQDRLYLLTDAGKQIVVVSLDTLQVLRRYPVVGRACPHQLTEVRDYLWMPVSTNGGDCEVLGALNLETGEWSTFPTVPRTEAPDGEPVEIDVDHVADVPGSPDALIVTSQRSHQVQRLAIAVDDGGTPSVQLIASARYNLSTPRDIETTPDGELVYLAGNGGAPEFRRTDDLALRGTLAATGGNADSLSIGPDGRVAVGGGAFWSVHLQDQGETQPYRVWALSEYDDGIYHDPTRNVRLEQHSMVLGDEVVYLLAYGLDAPQRDFRMLDARPRERSATTVTAVVTPRHVTFGKPATVVVRVQPTEADRDVWVHLGDDVVAEMQTDARGYASAPVTLERHSELVVEAVPTETAQWATGTASARVAASINLRWRRGQRDFLAQALPITTPCIAIQVQRRTGRPGARHWAPTRFSRTCYEPFRGEVRLVFDDGKVRRHIFRARAAVAAVPGQRDGAVSPWRRSTIIR